MNETRNIRNCKSIIGEVNLVMYNKSNHTHIIFRVGERLYIYKAEMDDDDDYELDYEYCFIDILPYTYSQCLNEPRLLYSCVRNKAVVNNLKGIQFGIQESGQSALAAKFRYFLHDRYGEDIDLSSTRGWSDGQWDNLLKCKSSIS